MTLFAILLTGASICVVVYRRHPEILQSFEHLKSQVAEQTSRITQVAPGPTPEKRSVESNHLPNNQNTTEGSVTDSPNGSANVQVSSFDNHVSQQEIQQIETLVTQEDMLRVLTKRLGLQPHASAKVYVVQTAADYKQALSEQGLSMDDVQRLSHDTGGFTKGNVIVIPLYQNQSKADLANTLGHELTHVILNDNVPNLPSWMNEGLAVYNGTSFQKLSEDAVSYGGYVRRMAESVVQAAMNKQLIPLTADEATVLQGNAMYDIELQDWLAVSELLRLKGIQSVQQYLAKMNQGQSEKQAFEDAFGTSEGSFNQTFTNRLVSAGKERDPGVRLTFVVPPNFSGRVRFLQHGSRAWRSVKLSPGVENVQIDSTGQVLGASAPVERIPDSGSPDDATLYVNLESDQALRDEGRHVTDCGFAVDYHNGLYGFVDAWITFDSGQTEYLHRPTLFGVELKALSERQTTGPVLSWLKLN